MKRLFFLYIILMCSVSISAQQFKGMAIVGMNLTQVSGDEVAGYDKYGVNAGLGVSVPISNNKKWYISLEGIYNQKGSYKYAEGLYVIERDPCPTCDSTSIDEDVKYSLKLGYMEVPVLVHYEGKGSFTFGAGISWGRLISLKEVINGRKNLAATLDGGLYNRSDWNILADIRFRIWRQLKLNFRYAYSLVPIRKNVVFKAGTPGEFSRNQYNDLFSIRLIWVFNEVYVPHTNKELKETNQ